VVLAKPMTRTAGHCWAAARSAKSFLVLNCTSYPLVMSGFFGRIFGAVNG
jgi:transcriptional regulator of aromatic amino acid metabolism